MKLRILLGALLPAAIGLWSAGCSNDAPTGFTRAGDAAHARNTGVRLTLVSGDSQAGTAGQLLPEPLVVRVLDQRGQPVAGAVVTWKVMTRGGLVPERTTSTDAQGYARTRWTLGPARGEHTLRASGVGGTLVFTATAGEIPVPILQKVSGDSQSAPAGQKLPEQLVVRTLDPLGRPLRGIPVSWLVSAGGGSVVRLARVTADDGTARAEWTVGTPGPQEVRAAAANVVVRFTATATPVAPPAAVPVSMHVIPDPMWLTVGDTGRIRVVFLDAQGNLVPGPTPTFRSLSHYATVDGTGLVRSTVAAAGSIEVRAWPFRRFVAVHSGSRGHDRYGSPRNWLYVVPERLNFFAGDTARLSALWVDGDGTVTLARDAAWSSLSSWSVNVSPTGLVRGMTAGGAAIYATRGGRTARASVGVVLPGGWCCAMLFDGMTIAPAVVNAGAADGTVKLAVYYRYDGPTRLARFTVQVRRPDGGMLEQTWTGGSGNMTIPRGSPPGRYDIVRIRLVDTGDHVTDVYPSQLQDLGNPTYFTVAH